MSNKNRKSDLENPQSQREMTPDEASTKTSSVAPQGMKDCPLCGTQAEVIYGFGDGPERGRLICPNCGTVDWPPRSC
jgi:hypothetical protein